MKNNDVILTASLANKVRNRKLVEVPIDDLKDNPMNPPERTETNLAFTMLRSGVREYGVMCAIHFCGETMTKLDGHRRVKAARQAGETIITAYRYDNLTLEERDILFRHLNTTSVKYTGSQKLHTFLEGGAVDADFENTCNEIRRVGDNIKTGNGLTFLKTIRQNRKSPTSYFIGIKEYCKVVDDNTIKTQAKVLDWMMNVGNPHRLKSLISLKCPSHLLKKAVNGGKPIQGTWEITAV